MSFSWSSLEKPIYILAPMEDVTDNAFREMFAKYGKPSLLFTEFVSVDGLDHPEGRKKLSVDLQYTEIQRPIVGQIWGSDPEKFFRAAQYLVELGFDAIDINMGCPQTKEIAIGACAALIRTPKLAQEVIAATKRGAPNLPVSVKTRIGYSKTDEMESWLTTLLEMDLAAITLHGRTKKEMSKVPAHWDRIADSVALRDKIQATRDKKDRTIIIGNGDVRSLEEANFKIQETGVDGVMIGRGAFGNPWFFRGAVIPEPRPIVGVSGIQDQSEPLDPGSRMHLPTGQAGSPGMTHYEPTMHERFAVMLEHAELFEKMYTGVKSFAIMRKHFKAYCSGFSGAAEIRAELMETKSFEETKAVVEKYIQ